MLVVLASDALITCAASVGEVMLAAVFMRDGSSKRRDSPATKTLQFQ
jgi:hypothetical protein